MAVYALPAPTLAEALDPVARDRQALALIQLTRRERQIVELMAAGKALDEIAATLHIGTRWITRTTSALVTRTGSVNRLHLIARLIRAGKIR